MHETNQPQIKSEKLGRDASVQISGEGRMLKNNCINNDLVPRETEGERVLRDTAKEYEKAKAIWAGVRAQAKDDTPSADLVDWSAGYKLAIILQHLTSSTKSDRDYAKGKIRELVKLGKEQ